MITKLEDFTVNDKVDFFNKIYLVLTDYIESIQSASGLYEVDEDLEKYTFEDIMTKTFGNDVYNEEINPYL